MNVIYAFALLLAVCACTRARQVPSPPAEENAATEEDDAAEGEAADMEEPATAAPAPPKPTPSGGIISSGVKLSPEDKCKRLPKAKDQKACLERLRKNRPKQN